MGYTQPRGTRTGIGALHVAGVTEGVLTYCGRVGTGFSDALLRRLRDELDGQIATAPRTQGTVPDDADSVWVEPTLAATVRFKEVTADGHLRQPVFEAVSDLDEADLYPLDATAARVEPPPPAVIDARTTEPTNTDKIFWPDEGYTKGDLIEYYTAVADHLLPYLTDRPLVLDRYPDGIDGKSFFQKNAPEFVPDWIRTERTSYWMPDSAIGLVFFFWSNLVARRCFDAHLPTENRNHLQWAGAR